MNRQNKMSYLTSAIDQLQSNGNHFYSSPSSAEYINRDSGFHTSNMNDFHGIEPSNFVSPKKLRNGQQQYVPSFMYQTSGTDPGEEQRNIAIPISSFQSATNVQHRFVPQETSGQQIPATKSGSQKRKQRGTPTLLNNVTDQPGSSNAGTDSSFVIDSLPLMPRLNDAQRTEKEALKKAKQAEAARMRYHRLNQDEKKALNLKRTLAQKQKRQREKELSELEIILRSSNDIIDDPQVVEQLREKRIRARWADVARTRYQQMSIVERRNLNRRKNRFQEKKVEVEKEEISKDDEATRQKISAQNARKAEAARLRYHRMTPEEKKIYNQRRTEAFRHRRVEEDVLLALPVGKINGEALDRAQQIVIRNAKRAEAARLRYQRMTPEQRREYNQKRYTPRRKRIEAQQMAADRLTQVLDGGDNTYNSIMDNDSNMTKNDDMLSHLERDVVRRTMRAQQLLLLQKPRTANSPLKFLQQPQIVQSSQQNPSKTARIQQPSQQDQDRYIAASMASGIPILDQQLNQRSAGQALTQVVYTTRR